MQSQTLRSAFLVTVFAMGATTTAQAIPVQMSTQSNVGSSSASIADTGNTATAPMQTYSSASSCGSGGSSYTYSANPENPGSSSPDGCNSTTEVTQDYLNEPGDGGARRTQTVPYSSDNAYSAARASEYSGTVSFGNGSGGQTDFYKGYVVEQYTYDADGSEYGGYGGEYGGYGGPDYGGYGGSVYWYTDSYTDLYGDAEAFDTSSFQELALEGVNTSAAAQNFTLNFHIPNSSVSMNSSGGVATLASFVPDEQSGGAGTHATPTTFDADNDGITDDLDDDDDNDGTIDSVDPDRNGDGVPDLGYTGPAFEGSVGVNAEIWLTRGTGADASSERLWGYITTLTSNGENIYYNQENLVPGSGAAIPTYNCYYFGYCSASNFYGALDLGVFDPGEAFSVSYIIRTWSNSAGGTYNSESGSYGYFYGYAQFGDPFNFDGQGFDPLNSFETADVAEGVPVPAAAGLFGLGLFGLGALRRRRIKN